MTVVERTVVVEESVVIDAEPEEVWRVFSRLDRWPTWNPACSAARHLSGTAWKKGAIFELTLKPWWRKLTFKPTVMESDIPERIVWVGKGGGVEGWHTFTFEQEGSGTKVTSYESFSGPLLWVMPLVSPERKVRHMFTQWLEGLKAEVEKDTEAA